MVYLCLSDINVEFLKANKVCKENPQCREVVPYKFFDADLFWCHLKIYIGPCYRYVLLIRQNVE